MSTTKYTPGPWKVGDQEQSMVVYGPNGYAVADTKVFHGRTERAVAESNARLIAAAPDLLDACKKLVNHHGESHTCHTCIQARAAIAKAGVANG